MGWNDFCDLVKNNTESYNIVILSFKYQDEIIGKITSDIGNIQKGFKPTRKSAWRRFLEYRNTTKFFERFEV